MSDNNLTNSTNESSVQKYWDEYYKQQERRIILEAYRASYMKRDNISTTGTSV